VATVMIELSLPTPDALSCPFCDGESERQRLLEMQRSDGTLHTWTSFVECRCGARGPQAATASAAIAAWNRALRRALDARSTAGGGAEELGAWCG